MNLLAFAHFMSSIQARNFWCLSEANVLSAPSGHSRVKCNLVSTGGSIHKGHRPFADVLNPAPSKGRSLSRIRVSRVLPRKAGRLRYGAHRSDGFVPYVSISVSELATLSRHCLRAALAKSFFIDSLPFGASALGMVHPIFSSRVFALSMHLDCSACSVCS